MEEEMSLLMNESCQYKTMSLRLPVYRLTLSSLYIITAITSMILNALVIVSIWKTPSLHKPSYILIANLAITDFIVGAVAEPSMFMVNLAALEDWETVFCYSSFVGRGSGYWMAAMSLYTLTAISVDRLLAIKLKNRYRTLVTPKKVLINLIVWWVGTCCLLALFKLDIDTIIIILSIYLFLLLGTLATCYTMSYYSLKRMMLPVSSNSTRNTPRNNNESFHAGKYRRTLNTTLLVFFTVMLFYSSYFCSLVTTAAVFKVVPNLSQSEERRIFLYKFITSGELVVYMNSTMNPFLYLWRMRDLSRAAKETLKWIFGCTGTRGENPYTHRSTQQR